MSKEIKSSSTAWTVESARTLYDAEPYLRLDKQVVRLPGGQLIDDYHWLEMPPYSVICPITVDNKVVMLRGYKHGIGRESPMLPGGHLEVGEGGLEAAKRELMEETGYGSGEWKSLGAYVPHGNYGCGKAHLFKASNITRIGIPTSGDIEEMEILLVDFNTVIRWIREGEIQSLVSVAVLSLVLSNLYA